MLFTVCILPSGMNRMSRPLLGENEIITLCAFCKTFSKLRKVTALYNFSVRVLVVSQDCLTQHS